MRRRALYRAAMLWALLVSGALCASKGVAYHIFTVQPDGSVGIQATAVWKIARKGMMFGKGTEILNVNSLNTYPDYPELGFDTPQNRDEADRTAAEINEAVHSAHEDGRKALLWSYEIENPPILLDVYPQMMCGEGTGWYEYRTGEKRYPRQGMCIYKPGSIEFIQKRFDEIFRRCPDVDGILFSLHEGATRPVHGSCDACRHKTAGDKVTDTINLLHECIARAMQKVRPGKVPLNYAREHGLSYAFVRDDPVKARMVAEGLSEADDSVPVIVRGGLGDYFEFMITSPLLRHDQREYPGPRIVGLAERASHPYILDGASGVRHLDMPATIPVYNGLALQRDFLAADSPALRGWGYTRTRNTGETTVFRLNALTVDTACELLISPRLDLASYVSNWYEREMGLTPGAAKVFSDIVFRGYAIDVLATSYNGINFPLHGSGGVRGDAARWAPEWWDRPGHHFPARISAIAAGTDSKPVLYGFGQAIYGFGPEPREARMTPAGKLDYLIQEKVRAVALARESLRQATSVQALLPEPLATQVLDQCKLTLWFTRVRLAQSRAFWTWWYLPETPPERLRSLYSQYERVLSEDIPDGFTMSAAEIKDDELHNPYWGKKRFEETQSDFPFAEGG